MDVRKYLEQILEISQDEDESDVDYRLRMYNKAYDEIESKDFDNLPELVAQWINDCMDDEGYVKKVPPEFPGVEDTAEEVVEPTEEVEEESEIVVEEEDAEIPASECKVKKHYRIANHEDDTVFECTSVGKKIVSFLADNGDIMRINGSEKVILVGKDELIPDDYIDVEEEEGPLLPEDSREYFNKKDRDRVLSTMTKDIKEVAKKSGIKVDEKGYTRVEAFIDALKEGGTKEDIISRSNQNYVIATKKGELNNIMDATYYYKVLQRFCWRLGLVKKKNERYYFQDDVDKLVEGYLKKIL